MKHALKHIHFVEATTRPTKRAAVAGESAA